jgi:hypothetical protein
MQLLVDVAEMHFDGRHADEQLGCDLLVGKAAQQQLQNLVFPAGKPLGGWAGRRWFLKGGRYSRAICPTVLRPIKASSPTLALKAPL